MCNSAPQMNFGDRGLSVFDIGGPDIVAANFGMDEFDEFEVGVLDAAPMVDDQFYGTDVSQDAYIDYSADTFDFGSNLSFDA